MDYFYDTFMVSLHYLKYEMSSSLYLYAAQYLLVKITLKY